jgi:hypothetical protein
MAIKLPLTGGCQCGALRYEVSGSPRLTYVCHCTDCQHVSGSAFSVAFFVSDGAFQLTNGQPRLVNRTAENGRTATRWLCPACGSWVSSAAWSTPSGDVLRVVQGGSLDDNSWLRPTTHFWTRSKQPWVTLPAGDRVYETQPG